MSGLVKSKRLEKVTPPVTPINKVRSKSAENNIFFYPRKPFNSYIPTKIMEEVDCESKTIKKEKSSDSPNLDELISGKRKGELD